MPYIPIVLILLSFQLSAEPDCEDLVSTKSILQCVISQNSQVQASKMGIQEAKSEHDIAAQWLNPELDADLLFGNGPGIGAEISVLQTFELGGKRNVRKALAKLKQAGAELNLNLTREDLVIKTLLTLYRLRQIDAELKIYNEIFHTYNELIEQYEDIGKLDSEREISLSVFKMSLSESEMAANKLRNERTILASGIESGLGRSIDFEKLQYPKFNTDWPRLEQNRLNSTNLKLAQLASQKNIAELKIQKANAWPDLKIGPKIAFEQPFLEQNGSVFWGGISFNIGLPVLHQNQAKIKKAQTSIKKSEISESFLKRRLEATRDNFKTNYVSTLKTFKRALLKNQIVDRHKYFHQKIEKGLVSAPMVIELHRQLMGYYSTLHEQELQLVNAFWGLKKLNGTILEEVQS